MRELIPYFINGISVGGQYALIAIGYTLVYGILRLINFAHGDVFMVAGLVMVYATTAMPFYLALPLVLIVTVVLGFLIERVAYKPLRSAPRMSLMISAIGVSYLIQNLAFYITGGVPQPVSNPIPWISENVAVLGTSTKRVTLVTPVLTIVLVVVLVYLIYLPLSVLIPSSSGLATLSVPVVAPLGQFAGVGGDVVVTAFQSACGLVNLVTPTAAVVMGALALGRIPYEKWLKFVWKLMLLFLLLTGLLLVLAAALS